MSRARGSRSRTRSSGGSLSGNKVLKWVLIIGTLFLFLLFVAGLGLKMWLSNYRQSEAFRKTVAAKVGEALKAEVELASFTWEDQSVFADGFHADGYEDAAVSLLQLDGLRASFGGIANQAWQIPEVTINRMNLEFSNRRLRGAWADRAAAATTAPASGPSWLERFIPSKFETGDIRIDAGNLTISNDAGAESFALQSVQTLMRQSLDGVGWGIDGQRGELRIAGQPEMDIDRFSVRWQGNEVFINEAVVDLYDGAHITADGVVVFPGGGADLNLLLRIANLDVTKVAGPEWANKLSGTLRGTVKLAGRTGSPEGLRQSGTLHLDDGVLVDLPLLDKIAKYTRNQRFKRLALNETTADFVRVGDRVEITNLVVQSDGLSRLEGDLTIEGRSIAGMFRLGVTPGTLSWIPGAERKVFIKSSKGFLWTNVLVAGTLDDPREDLSARLVVAAAETIVEDVPRKAIEAAEEAIRNPTSAPSSLLDKVRDATETLVPLLPVP